MNALARDRLTWRVSQQAAAFFVALWLTCSVTGAAQAEKRCGEETIRPRLEVLHKTDLQQSDPVAVRTAIVELGRMRCADSIDDLIGLLTFRFPYPKKGEPLYRPNTGTRYPATDALMEIGKAALPALVKVIETNDPGSLVSKNARYAARTIFAYRDKEGDEFFRQAAEKADTPEAKERLLKALETAAEDMRSD